MKGCDVQSMRVNNKIRRTVRPQEDLQHIYEAIEKNQQHLESFCQRNKMKFPPITHTRYGPFSQLSRVSMSLSPAGLHSLRGRKLQGEAEERQEGRVQWLQKKASICKIMFSQGDRSKSQARNVHYSRLMRNGSNESILRSIHGHRPRLPSKEKSMQLQAPTSRTTTLHHFIEELNLARSHRESTSLLSQSLDHNSTLPLQQGRYELLSINRMSTINPEAELMRTLRGKNLTFEKSVGETRRQFQVKDLSRISFYKNADGIIPPKKNQSLGKRQVSLFEPWQGNQQQQDFLSEIEK